MPKETFYNLPEDKKKRIIDAAVDEIVRVPISEISINQIIQNAGISRGSFYQYFEDKHDLLQYMLTDYINVLKEGIVQSLKSSNGNVFEAMERVLHGFIEMGKIGDNQKGLKNILMEASIYSECSADFIIDFQEDILKTLIEKMDRKILKDTDDESAAALAGLLISALKDSSAMCFYHIDRADEIESEFKRQLKIIKRGAEKESNYVKI